MFGLIWALGVVFSVHVCRADEHDHTHPKEQFMHADGIDTSELGDSQMGSLVAKTTGQTKEELTVTVSWENLSWTGKYDWIGLFKYVQYISAF